MQPDILLNNRYRVIYAVDERPSSQLLRARDEQNGALVLVSILALMESQRESTAQLAKQVAAVQHELLVPLIDHFADGERYMLVSPDPGGQDLDRALRASGGPLPEQETLESAAKLLQLFDVLHEQKPPLYVGDIWPSDIVVTPNGWRMLPFALARLVGTNPSPYRAPELADPDVEPSNETDTYAISALVYYALTGVVPATPQQQQSGLPLAGPRSLNPTLSALAEQVLLRALQQKPANRYQNARELRLALETVHLMAGRSLGLGPDILRSPEVIAATARSTPQAPATMPLLQDVPVPSGVAAATPIAMVPQSTYQPTTGQRRGLSTGCLIALAIGLGVVVVALAVALVFAIALNGSLFAGIFGRGVLPGGRNAGVPLSPQAITLANVSTITYTTEITSELFGAVSYDPSGNSLAVGLGSSIRIMDANLREQRVLKGHNGRVFAISYAPDGKQLASVALDDPDVRIWNAEDGQLLHTLRGHTGFVRAVVISPDGKMVASGATDKTIRLWSLDGSPLKTLEGHSDWLSNLVFSPDGKLLASSSRDGTVRLWDMPAGTPHEAFSYTAQTNAEENKPFWTTGLAFTNDGARLAIGSRDGSITIAAVTDGNIERRITAGRGYIVLRGLVFSKDNRIVYSAASDGTVKAWDVASGSELGEFSGHTLSAIAISLRPDGTQLASASDDEARILVWDTANRRKVNETMIGRGLVTELSYVPNTSVLGITSFNGALSVRSDDGHEALVSPAGSALATVFLRDTKIGVVTDQNEVRLFGANDNSNVKLEGLDGTPSALATNRAGSIISAGSVDGAVVIWDEQGTIRQQFKSELAGVSALALSDDGQYIAVGGTPTLSQIKIHDVRSGRLQQTLVGPRAGVVTIQFEPGGSRLAALDNAGELFIWDGATGKLLELFNANQEQIGYTAIAFAPDGKMLVAGTANGELVAWNTETNQQAAKLTLEADAHIFALAFRPDGEQLAASVRNGSSSVYTLEITK